jgi:glutamate racemase
MIGVFDSGFGGLMVHRALIEALPERDFVYLGDNRNAPYGVRPPIAVLNLTCTALEPLFAEGCTLAVLACNTASTVALRWIQQQWLPVRRRDDGIARNVIGIVAPAIEAATGIGWYEGGSAVQETKQSSTVSVFATRRTIHWAPSDDPQLVVHSEMPRLWSVSAALSDADGSHSYRELARHYDAGAELRS